MRYHLMVRGKRTTITVDEVLAQYLLAKIGGFAFQLGGIVGASEVRRWIRQKVKREAANIPEKNISQWVQALIIHEIANPDLREKIDKQAAEREKILTEYQGLI